MKEYLHFMEQAALESDDPVVQIGCVVTDTHGVIRGMGTNRLPRGITSDMIKGWPEAKSNFMCHAEREAIMEALLTGRVIEGGSLYVNAIPCSACAQVILKANISKVHILNPVKLGARWRLSQEEALEMFTLRGVEVVE